MNKWLLVGILMIGSINASKEVRCVCADKTRQVPDCGICGTLAGTMEKTETGATCICPNNLELKHDASCAQACEEHGGWTGGMETN